MEGGFFAGVGVFCGVGIFCGARWDSYLFPSTRALGMRLFLGTHTISFLRSRLVWVCSLALIHGWRFSEFMYESTHT